MRRVDNEALVITYIPKQRRSEIQHTIIDLLSRNVKIQDVIHDISVLELGDVYFKARQNQTLDDCLPYWEIVASVHEFFLVQTALSSAAFGSKTRGLEDPEPEVTPKPTAA